jgi:hypothetical protein
MKYYGKELKLHEYIQEMKFLSKYPNVMSVSEGMIHLKPPKICGRRPKGIKYSLSFFEKCRNWFCTSSILSKYKEMFARYDEVLKIKAGCLYF